MTHRIPKSTDFAFHGILSALVTPFDAHGAVDVDRLASFVEYLIDRGVHGLIPLGSTGEYYALTPHEREVVIRTTLEAANGQAYRDRRHECRLDGRSCRVLATGPDARLSGGHVGGAVLFPADGRGVVRAFSGGRSRD